MLDVGCGDGATVRLLAPRLPRGAVVGIDPDAEAIRQARRLSGALDNVLFAPAPAERIPWAEDYFTHVLAVESACSWPQPERVAQEIFRVTAYGGHFHLLFSGDAQSPCRDARPADAWSALFADCGFERVAAERIPGGAAPAALYLGGRKPGAGPGGGRG